MATKHRTSKTRSSNNGVAETAPAPAPAPAQASSENNNNDATAINVEDFMHCPVCGHEFREPKMLPCLHSFCEECLESSLQQSEVSPGESFLCPLCRTQCTVPAKGVSALKTNIFLVSALEFADRKRLHSDQQCNACDTSERPKKKCIECDDWLCSRCCSMHKKVKITKDHHLASVDELQSGRWDDMIKQCFDPLMCGQHKEPLKLFCCQPACSAPICTVCKTTMGHDGHLAIPLEKQGAKESDNLISLLTSMEKVMMATETRRSQLKEQDKQVSQMRKKMHKIINERVDVVVEAFVKHIGQYAEALHTTVDQLGKERKKELSKELEELDTSAKSMSITRQFTHMLLDFSRAEETVAMSRDVAQRLSQFQKAPPSDPPAWKQPRLKPAEDMSPDDLTKFFGSLAFEGDLIRSTLVRSFTASTADDEMPCALCDIIIDHDQLYVVDKDNRTVKVFTTTGQLVGLFGSNIFTGPNRITAMRASGMLLVKDDKFLRVVTREGKLLGNFAEELKQPVGLAQTADGEILITDWLTGCVHGFSERGDHKRNFRSASEAAGYICTVPSAGKIALTDWKMNCVKLFDSSGRQVAQYGEPGPGTTQLDHPYGICSDAFGHIIVADTWNNRVCMLSDEAKFMKIILAKEHGMEYPQAVVVDPSTGYLVVAEKQGTIKIFQYLA